MSGSAHADSNRCDVLIILFPLSVTQMLTTQADRFSSEEVHPHHHRHCHLPVCLRERFDADVCGYCSNLSFQMEQMFTAFPPDVAGNLDYKNLVHIITHGEEKDQE